MAVTSARYISTVDGTETLTVTPTLAQASPSMVHSLSSEATLSPTTSVPVSTVASGSRTLSAGTDTLDLTAIPDINSTTKSLSGLKVQLFKVKAATGNTQPIVVKRGSSNGYFTASDQWSIPAGGEITLYFNYGLSAVSGSAKNVDVTSAMATAGWSFQIWAAA